MAAMSNTLKVSLSSLLRKASKNTHCSNLIFACHDILSVWYSSKMVVLESRICLRNVAIRLSFWWLGARLFGLCPLLCRLLWLRKQPLIHKGSKSQTVRFWPCQSTPKLSYFQQFRYCIRSNSWAFRFFASLGKAKSARVFGPLKIFLYHLRKTSR